MQEKLVKAAKRASSLAYAPYSNFHVGAALLTWDDVIYTACNIENASFGATICAERAAVAIAVSEGKRSFKAIAIYAETDEPISPCGICRQVLAEFSKQMTVYCSCKSGKTITYSLSDLLPDAFDLQKSVQDE